jgi:hypothetical protein
MPEIGQIRVLVTKEGDYWVAQCLEYDIGAQARDPNDLPKRLMAALEAQRQETIKRHGRPFAGINRAPDHFFEAWDKRNRMFKPTELKLSDDPQIAVELALAA